MTIQLLLNVILSVTRNLILSADSEILRHYVTQDDTFEGFFDSFSTVTTE